MKLLLCWPDSRSAPSSQAGWNPAACPVLGRRNWTPGGARVSPGLILPCLVLSAVSLPRSACLLLCPCISFSSLLPGHDLPAVPIRPHPSPLFPPSPLSPLFSCEEQSSISWDLALARGLHLSSLLSLRSRVGLPTSPQLCLKEPHPGQSSCGRSVPGCAAPCEILAGPLPGLPNGGAVLACFPHPVQGHQQGPPAQLEITPRPHQLPFALPVPCGSPLPLLMPWTLPELTVTIWMVPLPGCPCSGVCTERLPEGP